MYDFTIGICAYGSVTDGTFMAFERLRQNSSYRYNIIVRSFDALIGRSRSVVASQFLKTDDSPFLIFIDTDIVFNRSQLDKLIQAMQQGYDVVAGAYSLADPEKGVALRGYGARIVPDGGIHEIEMASTGFVGISRKALEQIRDKLELPLLHKDNEDWECYPFFESGRDLDRMFYISEDWNFCEKVRQAGMKVYWHTDVMVGHIKSRAIPAEEAIRKSQYTPNQVSMKCPVQVSLVADLAEFLGISEEEAEARITDNPPQKVADEWHNWEGEVEDFYKHSKEQIFDLVMFNRSGRYWTSRLEPVWTESDKTILDFGCGIGSASLYLAMNRNNVVGYDINPQLIQFAEFRKEKFGLNNVTFTTEKPDISQFDLIIATDMLEHIKDLKGFLVELGQNMKVGARLYHYDVFGAQEEYPMHFNHQPYIDEWLDEAGLTKFDERWAIKCL